MSTGMKVGLLGFGEVGQILADDLTGTVGVSLYAYDPLFSSDNSKPGLALKTRKHIKATGTALDLAQACDLIVCAVTAAEDIAAIGSISGGIAANTWVMDLNSVSPDTKRLCAHTVDSAGGRYVEAALMSPIGPKRIASPFLLGGPHAAAFLSAAQQLGFTSATVFSADVGAASATKMCRSVIIKGMEALLTESMLAARYYGVEKEVLASLNDLLTGGDWQARAHYMISRSVEHGVRRAEEMREVASTVKAAGVDPLMSIACVARQEWAAQFPAALKESDLQQMLDRMK
jgi:3-hydroxyisobutyrate dehydrogenase-like beta-hydroxyacid dehydrogenase